MQTRSIERRRRRGDTITQALTYQLLACCEDGGMHAMVVADEDGLPLAASGDRHACDEVAATMVRVGSRTHAFSGTLLGIGQRWDVEMAQVMIDGSPLLVWAVGGTPEQRKRQIARGAQGTLRILGAA
jgi:predicted regulator of Ras-like GTPase activity (Roadblock/LC7/MglB family)